MAERKQKIWTKENDFNSLRHYRKERENETKETSLLPWYLCLFLSQLD